MRTPISDLPVILLSEENQEDRTMKEKESFISWVKACKTELGIADFTVVRPFWL